jgi:hypothetical protein
MRVWALILFLSLARIAGAGTHAPEGIPTTHAVALDGHGVDLPRDLQGRSILVVGFTRTSEAATTSWEKKLRSEPATSKVSMYNVAMLAEVPSILRGMVVRSIRKKVPEFARPNFIPITEDEDAWKRVCGFTSEAPDAAYVLLVERNGMVVWRTHESISQSIFNELSTETHKL